MSHSQVLVTGPDFNRLVLTQVPVNTPLRAGVPSAGSRAQIPQPARSRLSVYERNRQTRLLVAVEWADQLDRILTKGVFPAPMPPFGHWRNAEPVTFGRYLTDTYTFPIGRALAQTRTTGDLLLVEINPQKTSRLSIVPDPLMIQQMLTLAEHDSAEAGIHEILDLDTALDRFGVVIHRGAVPPQAITRILKIRNPRAAVFQGIPGGGFSVRAFPVLRQFFAPIHDWFMGGCEGTIPLYTSPDRSFLGEDAAWVREDMSDEIRSLVTTVFEANA